MEAGVSPARQARVHRHELRTLTYVTIDDANGGVVRNLTEQGMGAQMITALRPQQVLRLRFELSFPRLRVETRGEVTWANPSGQCGIRFLDLSPKMARQINEWIFSSLLEETSLHSEWEHSTFAKSQLGQTMFTGNAVPKHAGSTDGLMVSGSPVPVIQMPVRDPLPSLQPHIGDVTAVGSEFDWLFRPLSGRTLAWTINSLVILAAMLLFGVVFLSVTGEPPRRPVITVGLGAIFVAALYWGFFRVLGGSSPGARLARMAGCSEKEKEVRDTRFR